MNDEPSVPDELEQSPGVLEIIEDARAHPERLVRRSRPANL